MDISDYEDGFFGAGGQELVDVVECWLVAVVTIAEEQVQFVFWAFGLLVIWGVSLQPFVKEPYVRLQAGPRACLCEGFTRQSRYVGVAWKYRRWSRIR